MYYSDQPFHTKFFAATGDTVAAVAKRRGFSNPGPLLAYPPNQPLFSRKFGPTYLATSREFPLSRGDLLYLPWREEALLHLVVVFEGIITDTRKDADDMIEGLKKNKEELESFLMKLDILAVAAGAFAGAMAAAGVYAAELKGVESVFLHKLIKTPIGDFALGRYFSVGGVVAVSTDAPSAASKRWDTLRLFIRHTLNVPSPSYWASVWEAIQERDANIWWIGPDHIAETKALEIALRAKAEVQNFQNGVFAAKRQLALPFYKYRV